MNFVTLNKLVFLSLVFFTAGCQNNNNLSENTQLGKDLILNVLGSEKKIKRQSHLSGLDPNPTSRENIDYVIVADNQSHNFFGDASYPQSIEYASPVMIRPPQSELWSSKLLEWIGKIEKGQPIIHLGDAADISCENEISSTFKLLDESAGQGNWVMAPGNHDGLFFGSFEYEFDSDKKREVNEETQICRRASLLPIKKDAWKNACSNRPLDKARFVEMYVKRQVGGEIIDDGSINKLKVESALLKTIYYRIDKGFPPASFVVQELSLAENVVGIVIDTANYSQNSKILGYCGLIGEISPAQNKLIESLISMNSEKVSVVFGHHPAKSFELSVRRKKEGHSDTNQLPPSIGVFRTLFLDGDTAYLAARDGLEMLLKGIAFDASEFKLSKIFGNNTLKSKLNDWAEKGKLAYYLSAHGHKNGATVSETPEQWMELNIGSTIDWPVEYWRLKIRSVENDEGRLPIFIGSTQRSISDMLVGNDVINGLDCSIKWKQKDDYYLRYRNIDITRLDELTRAKYLIMLKSYELMAFALKKDSENRKLILSKLNYDNPKSALIDLERITNDVSNDDKIWFDRYKSCQALWAAQVDDAQTPDIRQLLQNNVFH